MIEQIKEEMCDRFCKWPTEYLSLIKDPDKANERMINEICIDCPLDKLTGFTTTDYLVCKENIGSIT